MELHRTDEGFALYKEKNTDRLLRAHARRKGAAITAFGIEPQWRRKGYGSYLLKKKYCAPTPATTGKRLPYLPPRCPPMPPSLLSGANSALPPRAAAAGAPPHAGLNGGQVRAGLSGRPAGTPRLCIDATCGNGGDTAFLCGITAPEGKVVGF